jgi:octaprenyl-diphosphate synthase
MLLQKKCRTSADPAGPVAFTAEEFLARIHPPCRGLHPVLRYVFQSEGKRIRPRLLCLSARLFDPAVPHLAEAVTLVEALHNGTLLHDDVMDRASLRRNRPTVNRLWGDGVAILAGDFLLTAAVDLALRTQHDSVLPLAVETLMELVAGQMMELQNHGNLTLEERTALLIIEKKTGSLFAMACKLGGLLGGGRPEDLLALEAYGLHLGTAFQLLDDIRDFLSARDRTGKEPGRDLAEGKVTLPVLAAFRRADTADKKRIRRIYADPRRAARLGELTALLEDNGGFACGFREAEGRLRAAVSALEPIPKGVARDDMERAAWAVIKEYGPHRLAEWIRP